MYVCINVHLCARYVCVYVCVYACVDAYGPSIKYVMLHGEGYKKM